MEKKRSKGLTILSLAEIILGFLGLVFATRSAILMFTMCWEGMNFSVEFLPLFVLVYVISLVLFIAGALFSVLKPIRRIQGLVFSIPILIVLIFIVWFLFFKYQGTNVSVGIALFFASAGYLISLPMFIAGVFTFFLKPAGRILTICYLVFFLPLSIFLMIYLLRTDVKGQFEETNRVRP
ncbi:MAG: hypothetical protein JW734_03970 [Candidatus Omnitrophica bacterium]|nr:hypothetical protein [Candidatus Omnitrophota bacterium]